MNQVHALVTAASTVYCVNCALGASVAQGWVDTSDVRWVHHGLYIATSALTVVACGVAARRRSPAALALAPAAVPLFLLQRHGARPLQRHTRDALAAAPCYAAGLALARR